MLFPADEIMYMSILEQIDLLRKFEIAKVIVKTIREFGSIIGKYQGWFFFLILNKFLKILIKNHHPTMLRKYRPVALFTSM